MVEAENDFYEKRPQMNMGKIIIAGVVATIGLKMVDPQVFNGIIHTVGSLSPTKTGGVGGLTCSQLDKQYHFVSPAQAGGYNFSGPQTASCIEIQRALEANHSPLAPFEPQIYHAYAQEGVNNAAAMGIAWQEGRYATATGVQQTDENIGAMRYNPDHAAFPNPNYSNDNGWMDFHAADYNGQATGWVASAEDHAALIHYWMNRTGNGSVRNIISILSPSSENDTAGYIRSVKGVMDTLYHESADYNSTHPEASGDSIQTTEILQQIAQSKA